MHDGIIDINQIYILKQYHIFGTKNVQPFSPILEKFTLLE